MYNETLLSRQPTAKTVLIQDWLLQDPVCGLNFGVMLFCGGGFKVGSTGLYVGI